MNSLIHLNCSINSYSLLFAFLTNFYLCVLHLLVTIIMQEGGNGSGYVEKSVVLSFQY